jgi:hypothetical protein
MPLIDVMYMKTKKSERDIHTHTHTGGAESDKSENKVMTTTFNSS